MTEKNNDTKSGVIDLGIITASEVSINMSTGVIATTEDKLKLALLERQEMLSGRDAWKTPLGIFISILLAIISTDFRTFLLEAPVWEAIFYIALIFAIGWFIAALIKRPPKKSIDDFIQQIKKKEESNEV